MLSALFESVDAEALPQRGLRLVATPRGAWRQFFQSLVLERETGLEPATSTLGRLHSTVELLPRGPGDEDNAVPGRGATPRMRGGWIADPRPLGPVR